jgi:hypothetical protein
MAFKVSAIILLEYASDKWTQLSEYVKVIVSLNVTTAFIFNVSTLTRINGLLKKKKIRRSALQDDMSRETYPFHVKVMYIRRSQYTIFYI